MHPRARTAVLDNPKQFPILMLFLKSAVREIAWRLDWIDMRSRPVAFAADPVAEMTPPLAFVERFTRCDDFGLGPYECPQKGPYS